MIIYIVHKYRSDNDYSDGSHDIYIKFITTSKDKASHFVKQNISYDILEQSFTPKKYHLIEEMKKWRLTK